MAAPVSLFERQARYPDPSAQKRFDRLVGIDDIKSQIIKSISIFLSPGKLKEWGEKYYKEMPKLLNRMMCRPPLLIFAGDVGTGKTEVAESVGDPVARQLKIDIILFPISLSARGVGRVGEMTQLISSSFEHVLTEAEKYKSSGKSARAGIIFLIDEADALAQSREASQMHHEDKAGVNALIRGIDRIANAQVPAVVIMCTNRLSAIDPAVRRRAAETIEFSRPNKEQIKSVLSLLSELNFNEKQVSELTEIAVNRGKDGVGFTYSDLTQKILPAIVLSAYPNRPIEFQDAYTVIKRIHPTPPFNDG